MSVEQLGEILAMLLKTFIKVIIEAIKVNIAWDVPRATAQQIIKDDPDDFFRRFLKFLANGGRVVLGGLKVATAPFDPVAFLGEKWAFWKGPKDGNGLEGEEERDKTSAALTEVDFGLAEFLTCLEKDEPPIKGEEKHARLKKSGRTRYGVTVFMGLWLDYLARETESVLEMLFKEKGITYIDFFGDILRDPDGNRCVLYLYRLGDGQWYWDYDWLDYDFDEQNFSAVSQQASSDQSSGL